MLECHCEVVFKHKAPRFSGFPTGTTNSAVKAVGLTLLLKGQVVRVVLHLIGGKSACLDTHHSSQVNMAKSSADTSGRVELRCCVVRVKLAGAHLRKLGQEQLLAVNRHSCHATELRVITNVVNFKLWKEAGGYEPPPPQSLRTSGGRLKANSRREQRQTREAPHDDVETVEKFKQVKAKRAVV